MKKKYMQPEWKIVEFNNEIDMLSTSSNTTVVFEGTTPEGLQDWWN